MKEEVEKLKLEIEKLKKINENKSDIISITSHQLRTSLSALKWIFKMFIDKDVGELTNEQNELIQRAYNSNERMLALVNDLLTLNHSEESLFVFKFEKTDFLYLVEQTLFEFSGETNKKEIELIFLRPENILPKINCDKKLIRVAVQNLIENSIKYSKSKEKVFISLKQKENDLILAFHDTGIGIKKEDIKNIFKKFYRAPNAQKKDPIGSGLGLYTAKNIVEKHNGKIWFESTQKGGTTFFISLPIV